MMKGKFDLEDYAAQLRQISKMGSLSGILGMLPGVGKIKQQLEGADLDTKILKRQAAIISSMTIKERRTPDIIKANRKKRIAAGSGTSVQEVNRLLKQFDEMSTMMKKMGKLGQKGLMRHGLGALMPKGMSPQNRRPYSEHRSNRYMGLKIRLARAGAKKRPYYHIVIADSRSPRDGRFIERVGSYNPMLPAEHADRVRLQPERVTHWLDNGAVATERVAKFLGKAGLAPMPVWNEQPQQSAPKKKAQERAKAAAAAAASADEPASDAMRSRIQLGVIGRAHGVRGLVKVTSHTADPADLTAYGPLSDAAGARLRAALEGRGRRRGVPDRRRRAGQGHRPHPGRKADQHEAVRRPLRAAAPRTRTNTTSPTSSASTAVDPAGRAIGTVSVVHDYGAGASLEIVGGRRAAARSRSPPPACRRWISPPAGSSW